MLNLGTKTKKHWQKKDTVEYVTTNKNIICTRIVMLLTTMMAAIYRSVNEGFRMYVMLTYFFHGCGCLLARLQAASAHLDAQELLAKEKETAHGHHTAYS